jgi:hypothetical protein
MSTHAEVKGEGPSIPSKAQLCSKNLLMCLTVNLTTAEAERWPGEIIPEIPSLTIFWSSRLAQNFDSNLYNDFRHSALDDLFTRHVDHRFNALIDFCRQTLVDHGLIPDVVVDDMVNLSQQGSSCHIIVSNTIHDALASGKLKSKNEKKVKKSFNTQHGETPEEKLPC